ncbi:MAG TPA: hypothetical protein VGR21_09375 [Cryptosporangiaceae bacterium]|nr:hypothetical protein [Cryptosporangiaceae bacterium]
MTGDESQQELREELRRVEAEYDEVRRVAADLRHRIGERWEGPGDAADTAAALTAVEEQEAFAAMLAARREELRKQLGLNGA